MGEEIERIAFTPVDAERFRERLEQETALVCRWLDEGRFADRAWVAGFEVEAWLLDRGYRPTPSNGRFLERVADPLVVPELAQFNVELNGDPQPLGARTFRALEHDLEATWQRCLDVANEEGWTLVTIGTLPTVREQDLSLRNVSAGNRYLALNQQVLALRGRRAIEIDIAGIDRLVTSHSDVMLEAAATAFQVHLQCPASQVAALYNASLVVAAALVALAANSPFLFGHELWDETRIPLFEQAVDTATPYARVTLGSGYLRHPADYFRDNVDHYPPLLPLEHDAPVERLDHLRLHNGTIWRWVRLLPGVGTRESDTHLRIEQRVMPAGPTIGDMIANAAVYVGAACALAAGEERFERVLPFPVARENFYAAARDGLGARLQWLDGVSHDARTVVLDGILPLARSGLELMGVERDEAAQCLDVVTARVETGRTGAWWQREHARRHGRDFERLVADYVARAHTGRPVHTWDIG